MLDRDLRSLVGVVKLSLDGRTRCFLLVMKLSKMKKRRVSAHRASLRRR